MQQHNHKKREKERLNHGLDETDELLIRKGDSTLIYGGGGLHRRQARVSAAGPQPHACNIIILRYDDLDEDSQ